VKHGIRRLTLDDMQSAAQVMRCAFDERLPSLAGLHTPEEDAGYFRDHLFPRCEVWGAFDPELVGFIAFDDEWIEQLYIDPQWQGRGIGRALLEIPKARTGKLRLWTFQQNAAARKFYERNGFVRIELTDGHANEHAEPDILYEWTRPTSAS
jgi:GNAT superfamily N-acetyltransferase